jgi:hypothetical protein
MSEPFLVAGGIQHGLAHYRIYELDLADHILAGYSVMCGAAALVRPMNAARQCSKWANCQVTICSAMLVSEGVYHKSAEVFSSRMTRRRSLASPPLTISEDVVGASVTEPRRTRRTQTIADSLCRGLRLIVRPATDPVWLLFCYGSDGKLEKRSLGIYPKIGIEKARRRAWECRLQVKGFDRPRKRPSSITLAGLFILYEDTCRVSSEWGRLKSLTFFVFKPLIFQPLSRLSRQRLQGYIDSYESPGSMNTAVYALNKVVAWAETCGLVNRSSLPLIPPKAGRVPSAR